MLNGSDCGVLGFREFSGSGRIAGFKAGCRGSVAYRGVDLWQIDV